eukprot:TRINITY_DN16353_c0_g1_i1.p1 TRINITY_DN16353_c0_g1~~TRINITY_DN16353_c0_g1_i1.p1  ORF type:complete len:135 (+),score=16.55 TRINITY_DN16353_c0_g1_i1:2-406(+)
MCVGGRPSCVSIPFLGVSRHKVEEEIQIFSDLVRNIESLEANSVDDMRCMVDVGQQVYMQAHVPDTSRLFVSVGLGFHVEFTRLEAKEFAAVKIEHLKKQVQRHTDRIAAIKADIKLVVEGIRELMNMEHSDGL